MEYSFVVDELNRPVSEYWIHVVKLARRSISNELSPHHSRVAR